LRRELAASNKTVDDLRRKTFQATEESKQLSRALANELGEGVSIEKAIEGSWRGRAQQIIVLKAKIKKLSSSVGDVGSSGTVMTAGNVSRIKRTDVDTKAQEDLAEMSLERKHTIDCIVEEKETLFRGNQLLEEKVQAYKARIKNLEADGSRQKQQIKVVLDVKDSDDELIDALQQEIHRFKLQAKTKSGLERDGMLSRQTQPTSKSDSSDKIDELQADVSRLQRLCKSQGDQISTQDEVIRSLRSRLG
jgi:murein L,D-transpeptidase YcbB/YkuD